MNEWQVYNPSHGKVGGYSSAYQREISRSVINIDYSKKIANFLLLVGFVIYCRYQGDPSDNCSSAQYLCMHRALALD